MSPTRNLLPLLIAVTLPSTFALAQDNGLKPIKSFDSEAELADLKAIGGQMHLENGALHLQLDPSGAWPQLLMTPEKPLDWSGSALTLEVTNPGEKPVEIGIRLDDDPAGDGWKHSWSTNATIAPGEKERLVFPLGADPMSFGMRGLPPVAGTEGTVTLKGWGDKPIDASHVTSWQLFVAKPKDPVNLLIRNIALAPSGAASLTGIIDEFGQAAHADWPGKIHNQAELEASRDAQAKELADFKPNDDLDPYGGWKAGPQLDASGFFRTQKVDGKWWLVDPDGHLFFSVGVDTVQSANPTIINGREAMFQNVPPPGDGLGKFRGDAGQVLRGPVTNGLAYDFAQANLWRKYGDEWPQKWNETTVARLKSWGFNTLGNWTSDALKQGADRIPYVATSGIYGDHARLSDGDDYWAKMHDPFDPKFADDTNRALTEIHDKTGDDPFCLGYFVENELSFGNGQSDKPKSYFGLVYGTLAAPPDQPAKHALIEELKKKYIEVGKLNAAWGTTFATWDALHAPYQAIETPNDAMKADFSSFLGALGDKYFGTVAEQMKKVAPHHLYLGSRFSGRPPLEIAQAAARHCDVVSFNIYAPKIDDSWAFLNDFNKPTIVGEFHVGSTDRGLWMPGLVSAKDQAERAATYKGYVENVLDNPNFVGCHWFQWEDEPATGRPLDGENYNIGFVDVTDKAYPEMVAAAKEVNGEIYARRTAK